jgi:hypothetical protein
VAGYRVWRHEINENAKTGRCGSRAQIKGATLSLGSLLTHLKQNLLPPGVIDGTYSATTEEARHCELGLVYLISLRTNGKMFSNAADKHGAV